MGASGVLAIRRAATAEAGRAVVTRSSRHSSRCSTARLTATIKTTRSAFADETTEETE